MTALPPPIDKVNSNYIARTAGSKPETTLRRLKRTWRRGWKSIVHALYVPVAVLMRGAGYRFVTISNPHRIGHLAAEIDWYLKEIALGRIEPARTILLLKPGRAANTVLLDIWREHILVISGGVRRRLLRPLLDFPSLKLDLGISVVGIDSAAIYQKTLNRWHGREPVARLPDELVSDARRKLRELGVPENGWFVCVHAREGGYSPGDEHVHAHRNSAIGSYTIAMDEIVARGGYCIRMGDPTMAKLEPRPGVIDYATSPFKSEALDIFLCANARFLLGNTSGLCMIATMFNVPSVLTNMIPCGAGYGVYPGDLSILKKLRDAEGNILRFDKIFESAVSSFRYAGLYEEYGLTPIDNTPEDIRDVTVEMLDRLAGTFETTPDDEARQARFRGFLRPHHYCYAVTSRIGRDFLRQRAHMFAGKSGEP